MFETIKTALAEKGHDLDYPVVARGLSRVIELSEGLPAEFMFMPGGRHHITARRGPGTYDGDVLVDAATVETLQHDLESQSTGNVRPYFDFDHDESKASAWPLEFRWREEPAPGVYVRVQWTRSGEEAVMGRDYRSFSPAFFIAGANPARITGAPLIMGGLVNAPAFKEILPLWAKDAGARPIADSGATHQPNIKMNESEIAALQARLTQMEQENTALKAKATQTDNEKSAAIQAQIAEQAAAIQAKEAEITAVRASLKEASEALQARRKADAQASVQAAVARGAVPPKDEAIQARWSALIEADPANLELLAKLPAAPALQDRIIKADARIQILETSSNDALRGYIQAKTPREKGMIYHRELNPRLERGERIPFESYPVEAANVLGTLVGNIISQRALALIASRRPGITDVVNDFSDAQAVKGQSVLTRTIGLPTVQNFGGTVSETADVDYPVTLSAEKEVRYEYAHAEYIGTQRDIVREHAEALALALGNSLVDAIAALITAAYTQTRVLAEASWDYSTITEVTRVLNTAGVPDLGRFGWVNSSAATALRNDELVMANFQRNTGSAYANWQNIEGFANIREFPALPENSIHLAGFFGFKDALLLATRIPANPETLIGAGYPGRLAVITDPVTGLSVLSNQWIDADTLDINDRLIILYGIARGNVTCGYTITHA